MNAAKRGGGAASVAPPAERLRAAQERVRALLGPDPADPDSYWRALALTETDWSAWTPPPAERAVVPDWREIE